MIWPGLDA
jgi:hypothetical protein